MSRFISPRYTDLVPYIPGEQPKDPDIIKLNANETSMPPSPRVLAVLKSERMRHLSRYTDPSSMELKTALSRRYAVRTSEVLVGNGSDEILGLIFLTFFEQARIAYPDVTYGFYRTMARSFGIDHAEIPLRADFTVDVDAYVHSDRHIVLANPNAPTGYVLPVSEIERIVAANPQRLSARRADDVEIPQPRGGAYRLLLRRGIAHQGPGGHEGSVQPLQPQRREHGHRYGVRGG